MNRYVQTLSLLVVVAACLGMIIALSGNQAMAQQKQPAKSPAPVKTCGGITGEQCGRGEYCDITVLNACEGADLPGTCTVVPKSCLVPDMKEVCGCDGKTYGNDCVRIQAQVQKSHDGKCEAAPQTCGGIIANPCPRGEYCDITALNACEGADLQGVCVKIPSSCLIPDTKQICGCDGKTYGNDCVRQQAQVQKAHDGKCSIRHQIRDDKTATPAEPVQEKK